MVSFNKTAHPSPSLVKLAAEVLLHQKNHERDKMYAAWDALTRHPDYEITDSTALINAARLLLENPKANPVESTLDARRKELNETNGFMMAPLKALPDLLIARVGTGWFTRQDVGADVMKAVDRLAARGGVETAADGWYRIVPNEE